MGAERSQWQFPANEVGKVIGWSDEASPSNPSASKGLVNKGPFVEPADIANMVETTDTDASGFDFVNSTGPLADSDTTLPAESVVKDYADTKLAKADNLSDLASASTARANIDLDHVINPKWYGVVGDGTTDDAVDFQTCVTAAAGRVIWIDGLTIRIPTGNEITVPSTGLHLAGKGKIVYEGTGTLFLGAQIDVTTYSHVATAGQTVFTDTDDYEGAYVEVYVNGVLRDHRNFTLAHDTTTLTVTFVNGAAALNDDVDILVHRINASTGILAAHAQVIVGAGVTISTTQADGRAFALGWYDAGFAAGRQTSSFVMEPGSMIRGETSSDGFRTGVWLHGFQNVEIGGYIFGVGANGLSPTQVGNTISRYGLLLSGEFTPSDIKLYGGMIGFYDSGVAALWGTVEGIHCTGFTWLNCGYAVQWLARSNDVGLLLLMSACHANCFYGIARTDYVSSVFAGDNDFFQGPNSVATQFIFFNIVSGGKTHAIHDNQMQSFVTGANVIGVKCGNGVRMLRSHDNLFMAADSTSIFVGHVMASGSYNNVLGPNTYENIDRAATVESGSSKIGLLTRGDVFLTPPSAFSRYEMAGSDWWMDEKWLVVTAPAAATSIANNTGTQVAVVASRNPESVTVGSNLITVPAGMTRARFKGRFVWASNATGVRGVRVLLSPSTETNAKVFDTADTLGVTVQNLDVDIAVTAAQQYLVQVYQNSGGALNINASELRVLFS